MVALTANAAGKTELLIGNEAIARGALEAGVRVAASYPGTPSSEILENLAAVAEEAGLYAEWSVNEKVAVEVGAAASFAGLRAIVSFKHEGLNVALDTLCHLNLTGTKGGLVVVVCDDPGGWSSPSENDSRAIVQWLNVPLFEPSTPQEAKDMTRWAFELSEQTGTYCVMRSITRVSHTTGTVVLGEIASRDTPAHFDTSKLFVFVPIIKKHGNLLTKVEQVKEIFEKSQFNYYEGPEHPELVMISSGSGRLYSAEAVECLRLEKRVGIVHLGTTWPVPAKFVEKQLSQTSRVLVVEEVDPFVERNLKVVAADSGWLDRDHVIYGKASGHIKPVGELSPEIVINALARLTGIKHEPRSKEYDERAKQAAKDLVIDRELMWCPGCPHRATFWTIKNAFRLDGRDGFVSGDIGCYALDRRGAGGYLATKIALAMGSGAGVASGLGKLDQFGFSQPVIAVCGDSTFYHAAIPALINAKYNRSDVIMMILDNSATAMTGFQPHPGVGVNAMGKAAPVVDIEGLCRGLDIPVEVMDPFDITENTKRLVELMSDRSGARVVIMRHPCVLLRPPGEKTPFKVSVDISKCRGDECGCAKYCVRAFKCPGLVWDRTRGRAQIDEAVCVGCGVCTCTCPASAIMKEPSE
ncbi:MAG: thiamine pyrophosphate-dependent enzyme [Dehalococcoidia bacterium]|nr:thiamine pyrophosphate-dependent enzyme [Dehalococcoidia bacterium]MDH4299552.1 thiamine pyrophosphate-dependent enzyme [Dehalococcoidia bacterium]MDH4366724.1 thiamine pyrophosphate-dependent enzyme [Dehalococcoidia bacterium]